MRENRTRRLRSRLSWAWIFVGIFWGTVSFGKEAVPFTPYHEIVEAVFPPELMKRRYSELTLEQKRNMERIQSGLLELIESTGPPWLFPLIEPRTAHRQDLQAVLQVIRDSPIWLCKDTCDACGLSRSSACALSKEFGNTVVSAVLISGCVVPGGPCSKKNASRVRQSEFIEYLQEIYAQIAYAKLNGVKDWGVMRPVVRKTEKILANYIRRGASMQKRCPHSFLEEDWALLNESGGMRALPEAWSECGRRYFEPLRSGKLPQSCQSVMGDSGLAKMGPLSIGRCDSWCAFLMCQNDNQNLKLVRFGTRWALFLPENACDGKNPLWVSQFVREWVGAQSKAKTEKFSEVQLKKCIDEYSAELTVDSPTTAKPYEFPKGPEIRWADE